MKTQHKTLSYSVTGSCIKCEKCDLLVLCFQHENVIHRIVNTGSACVCHFHDIWEFCLLIKMLERKTETVCPCVCFHLYVTVLYMRTFLWQMCVCVRADALSFFLSSIINVVFYWLPCSNCAWVVSPLWSHTRTVQRKKKRQTDRVD